MASFRSMLCAVFLVVQIQTGALAFGAEVSELSNGFLIAADADPLKPSGIQAYAGDEKHLDSILDGFEDVESDISQSDGGYHRSDLNFNGEFRTGAAYNCAHEKPASGDTDWRGLSKLKTAMQLAFETYLTDDWMLSISGAAFYDWVYAIRGRDQYTRSVLNHYESELELREAFLQGRLTKRLDLKLGRQIIVWGNSDNIRVTDVLNPLDLREPGLTDIKELRLPMTTTRLDYGCVPWRLGVVAIHEVRANKNPVFGSDFYPLDTPLPYEKVPDSSLSNTQWGLSLNFNLRGWDFSIHGASFYNHEPRFKAIQDPNGPSMELVHDRLQMLGAAFNLAKGCWLFKAEAAFIDGFQFFRTDRKTFSRLDYLAGLEYYGLKNVNIGVEAANRHLQDFDERLASLPDNALEDDQQYSLRASRKFFNDTLTLELLVSIYGNQSQNGAFKRFKTEYNLTDNWFATMGFILYQSGNKTAFRNIGDSDRVFFELRYCF